MSTKKARDLVTGDKMPNGDAILTVERDALVDRHYRRPRVLVMVSSSKGGAIDVLELAANKPVEVVE